MNQPDVTALNACESLFVDPARRDTDNVGPFVLVVDDYYSDPDAIRQLALAQPFHRYSPPLASQVGAAVAARFNGNDPLWLSSSLMRYHGVDVADPIPGFRLADDTVRTRLMALLNEDIEAESWGNLGDGWNGAFHLQFACAGEQGWSVHHHYKRGDVFPRGWSGLVYLTPHAPPQSGTSIWRDRETGRCTASEGAFFSRDLSGYDQVFLVENRFNRLVLFRENVLHRAEPGFGDSRTTARLTQTFFFRSVRFESRAANPAVTTGA